MGFRSGQGVVRLDQPSLAHFLVTFRHVDTIRQTDLCRRRDWIPSLEQLSQGRNTHWDPTIGSVRAG